MTTMLFTELHKLLGRQPGDIDAGMLQEATSRHIPETEALGWKKDFYNGTTDFPKDIAAMSNSGGGTIICGVTDEGNKASELCGVDGEVEWKKSELASLAVSRIVPPVTNVIFQTVPLESNVAIVIEVPPSLDSPHFIHGAKGDPQSRYMAAPYRVGAGTAWMNERQIANAYKSRFGQHEDIERLLKNLYDQATIGFPTEKRAYMVGVAVPRMPRSFSKRRTEAEAKKVMDGAYSAGISLFAGTEKQADAHADHSNFRLAQLSGMAGSSSTWRPGMRRWTVSHGSRSEGMGWWNSSSASIHDDGTVSFICAIGGGAHWEWKECNTDEAPGNAIFDIRVEGFVAGFIGLIEANTSGNMAEYEISLGIEWASEKPLALVRTDNNAEPLSDDLRVDAKSAQSPKPFIALNVMGGYPPIRKTITVGLGEAALVEQSADLGLDAVTQAGARTLKCLREPGDDLSTTR
jgi:hypothetical protein